MGSTVEGLICNSAQRLSASEIQHKITELISANKTFVLNAFRHQRFNTTASILSPMMTLIVLNAFRHQRFNTAPQPQRSLISCVVLNAFRHQRFNTVTSSAPCSPTNACSTPFGIRDSTPTIANEDKANKPCAQRLSASEIQH